jgi:dihydroorotase-like cyclic amidohydrolase
VRDGRIVAHPRAGRGCRPTSRRLRRPLDHAGRRSIPHVHFGFGIAGDRFPHRSRARPRSAASPRRCRSTAPPTSATAFDAYRDRAASQSCIDFGLHFGITSHLHVETLAECSRRFGVTSYKLYLMYKGAAGLAQGFTEIDDALLLRGGKATAAIDGAVLGIHCENVEVIPYLREPLRTAGRDDLARGTSRARIFLEAENVHRACYFAGKVDCPINIVHLSSREALDEVRRHRRGARHRSTSRRARTTCSSTTRACGVLAKVNPPVRGAADVDAMWEGIADGAIDTVGTDHVPRKRSTKEGKGIWASSNGFPA